MIPNVRAYDKINKKMIEDVASINFKAEMIVTSNLCFYPFDDVELMQSTGLIDQNGKEIFEGHIVKDTNGVIAYIVFLNKDMGYFIVYKRSDRRLSEVDNYQFEILGNIYQDKHLLWGD